MARRRHSGSRRGLGGRWRVQRVAGLLTPGFSKRFDPDCTRGVTYLGGVPIGAFSVERSPDGGCELRYRRWPVVDVLDGVPGAGTTAPIGGAGRVGVARRATTRFCRFELLPPT